MGMVTGSRILYTGMLYAGKCCVDEGGMKLSVDTDLIPREYMCALHWCAAEAHTCFSGSIVDIVQSR